MQNNSKRYETDDIFKEECPRAGDKWISFWRGSRFFHGSWIIFHNSLPLADTV